MLLITLPREKLDPLLEQAGRGANAMFTIDLERQLVVDSDGREIPFEIDGYRRRCLLEGVDEIGLSMKNASKIDVFEDHRRGDMPWLSMDD